MFERKTFWILLTLFLVFVAAPFLFGFGLIAGLLSVGSAPMEPSYDYVRGREDSENKILSIRVVGPILDEPEVDPFGELFGISGGVVYGYSIKDALYKAADNESIKAVMIEINSPGGTITGSNAIADGIAYYKKTTGNPVYAFGSGLVASGGYWVASATDYITIDKGSSVGSIGVIGAELQVYNGVVAQAQLWGDSVTTTNGIENILITAGEGKGFGYPYIRPTDKELQIAQEETNVAYDDFVSFVSQRRKINKETIVSDIGAHVYGEKTAKGLKLSDAIGNREVAYSTLAKKIGVGNDYQIVSEYGNSGLIPSLLGVFAKVNAPRAENTFCKYTQKTMVYHGSVLDLCK